jgi:hypothetical protein
VVILIAGLTITTTGGDGISQGVSADFVVDTRVPDCILTDNHRQGMSVGLSTNLLVERTLFLNTSGTQPQGGVDLEPDLPTSKLVNITFKDCVADGNAGHQFQAWPGNFNASTEPVSITFDNCRANGRGLAPSFGTAPASFFLSGMAPGLRGSISVLNSMVTNTSGPGALFRRPTAAETFSISFQNTHFYRVARCTPSQHGCASSTRYENYFFNFDNSPLSMSMDPGKAVVATNAILGGINFDNCTVIDDRPRPFLMLNASWDPGEIRGLSNVRFDGAVTVVSEQFCHAAVNSRGTTNVSAAPTTCEVDSMLKTGVMVPPLKTIDEAVPAVRTGRTVYVAPTARKGTGDGSIERPFTLPDAVTALRGKAAGASVLLRGGDYHLASPFVMTATDGGASGRPVTYQSFPGESARLVGGIEIPAAAFKPASVSHHTAGLEVAELAPLGITNRTMLGGTQGVSGVKSELFVDTDGEFVPRQLAQDPNPASEGVWRWVGYDDILTGSNNWFVFNDTDGIAERGKWCEVANSSDGLTLFGHWGDPGGVSDVTVKQIVPIQGADGAAAQSYNISLIGATWGTPGRGVKVSRGERFVAVDSLQFVDQPGEYWIDREGLQLYYIRLRNSERLFLSTVPSLATPQASMKHPQALVQLQGISWLAWTNITVAVSTQALFAATAVEGLVITESKFSGGGADCVFLIGNTSTIQHSTVAHCGATALIISGGNWNKWGPSLFVPANLSVLNNLIFDWARWSRTANSAGISWDGVGHHASGNVLRDSPEPAVLGNGNVDCIFEHNLIENVNYEQTDMGAYCKYTAMYCAAL